MNSFQSPVDGEPSLGTPHPHNYQILDNFSHAVGTHTIDVSAQVPVGTKAISITYVATSPAVAGQIEIQTIAGLIQIESIAGSASWFGGGGIVLLDSAYTFNMVVKNQNLTTIYMWMTVYWI
jgi:hypothetical protein